MSNKAFAYHDTFSNRLVWPDGIVTNSAGRMIPLYLDSPSNKLREAAEEIKHLVSWLEEERADVLADGEVEALKDFLVVLDELPPDDEPPAPPASRGTDDELVTALMVAQSDNLKLEEEIAGLNAEITRQRQQIKELTRAAPDEPPAPEKLSLAERYRAERNMLGLAIAAAAVKAGIIWESCVADGPTLVMLCDDLATMARGRPEKMND